MFEFGRRRECFGEVAAVERSTEAGIRRAL
jgi:hypothetical protein